MDHPCKQEVNIAVILSDLPEIKSDIKEILAALNNGLKKTATENQTSIKWLTWAVRFIVVAILGGTFWITRV